MSIEEQIEKLHHNICVLSETWFDRDAARRDIRAALLSVQAEQIEKDAKVAEEGSVGTSPLGALFAVGWRERSKHIAAAIRSQLTQGDTR